MTPDLLDSPYWTADYADGRELAEWLLPRLPRRNANELRMAQQMRADGRRVGFLTADRLITATGRHPLEAPADVWRKRG